jgi:hypothetical protein
MANSTPVQIQLTASAIHLAQGGTLTISALGKSYNFVAGASQSVTSDDWTWLQTRRVNAELLFEVVPAAPVATLPAATATAAKAPAAAAGPVAVPAAKPVATPEVSTEATKETPGK